MKSHQAIITLEISSVTELASAQQRMRVLSVSRIRLNLNLNLDPCCCCEVVDDQLLGHPYDNATVDTQSNGRDDDDNTQTLSFSINWNTSESNQSISSKEASEQQPATYVQLLRALHQGKNRLVLREWRQGACWWNLNMNESDDNTPTAGSIINNERRSILRGSGAHHQLSSGDASSSGGKALDTTTTTTTTTLSMAGAEVAGYRLAHYAINSYYDKQHKNNNGCSKKGVITAVYMPEVLYYSHDNTNNESIAIYCGAKCKKLLKQLDVDAPWALLSYFDNNYSNSNEETQSSTSTSTSCCASDGRRIPCHHFSTTMIKTRHEFGFDEPHPRHGRVPVDECLGYAQMILRDVIIPIQSSFFALSSVVDDDDDDGSNSTFHKKMELSNHLQSVGWGNGQLLNDDTAINPFQYHDMVSIYENALYRLISLSETNDNIILEETMGRLTTMGRLLSMLERCVAALSELWDENENDIGGKPPPLPPVLCHMDLQPQNLAFWRIVQDSSNNEEGHNTIHTAKHYSIASVMDWEEACYADPRFEVLLVCRKVLANREQADILWQSYSDHVKEMGNQLLSSSRNGNPISCWEVGPIEPWLKLETVHSLCTLLLQAMDLLGGGRSPWETKPDLLGKINRERERLVQMGWHFCDYDWMKDED